MARRDKRRTLIRRIAVVGDGVTEKIYFEQLKTFERLKNVVIKPELPSKSSKGGSFKKVINAAKSLAEEGYDHIYCLIDFDTILSEKKVEDFTKALKQLNQKEITVYINNPCFETWVLVHFEKTGKAFTDCGTVEKAVAKHLKGYCKNQHFLRRTNLYETLRPLLESHAIPNSEFLEIGREEKDINFPRAGIFNFFLEEKIVKRKNGK